MTILKQVQAIFGHLAYSKLQLYVPRGLWKHFRMHGEPVNLREQQDADEFFIRLKEAVEDALKALGYEQVSLKFLYNRLAQIIHPDIHLSSIALLWQTLRLMKVVKVHQKFKDEK